MVQNDNRKIIRGERIVNNKKQSSEGRHISNLELRSEEVHEILTRVPNWTIRYGNTLFLVIVIVILGISWLIRYPDVLTAETVITTGVPPQKEYAKTTGKISSIFVNDLQKVKRNSILAVLENTANSKDVYFLKEILDTINPKEKRLSFPMEDIPILVLGDIEPSYAKFENSYQKYDLNRRLNPFKNEATARKATLRELHLRLENLKSQFELNRTELELKEKDLARNKLLLDKGVISSLDFENKQLELMNVKKSGKILSTSISQIREALVEAKKNVKGTEITKTQEETKMLRDVFQSLNQLKLAVRDWENKYVLKSEINGKVSFLNYWSNNQSVNQGDLVFTIIPDKMDNFIAKVKAVAQNSGKIKVGQNVNIKLENFPVTEFGMLKGKVSSISLTPDDEGYYLIDVTLPEKLITSYNKEIEFRQEMIGTAEIITEDLRLLERFFYQFKQFTDN